MSDEIGLGFGVYWFGSYRVVFHCRLFVLHGLVRDESHSIFSLQLMPTNPYYGVRCGADLSQLGIVFAVAGSISGSA